ncbi:MAG: ABC transporter permease [Devosia sp.]
MIGFVLKRVAGLAVTLLLAAFLVFLVLDLTETSAGAPFWQRFAVWTGGALLGDFGISANGPIGALIAERLMVTAPLAAMAMLLAAAIGLPLGLLAARNPGSPVDRLVTGGMLLFTSLPAFWLGMLLALVFSGALRWLPSGGFVPWAQDPGGALTSLILPAVTLALPTAALLARSARAALAEVRAADFLRTARLKGLTPRQALWRHGLRNALLPVLARLGPLCAALIAGTIVVENVFYLPGLGRLMLSAIAAGEPAIVRGALVALMAVMVVALLAVDLLRAWADPRLRRGGA